VLHIKHMDIFVYLAVSTGIALPYTSVLRCWVSMRLYQNKKKRGISGRVHVVRTMEFHHFKRPYWICGDCALPGRFPLVFSAPPPHQLLGFRTRRLNTANTTRRHDHLWATIFHPRNPPSLRSILMVSSHSIGLSRGRFLRAVRTTLFSYVFFARSE
jgi:hypothetical protein